MIKERSSVVITGGASGIGKALAFRFGKEGNDIIIVRAAGLTQVFNHATHHRGQISTGFANFGIECPSFDHQGLGDFFLKYEAMSS